MRTAFTEFCLEKSMDEMGKNITIHDAINWSVEAWLEVSSYTIYASWKSILPPSIHCVEEEYQSNTSENEEDFPITRYLIYS